MQTYEVVWSPPETSAVDWALIQILSTILLYSSHALFVYVVDVTLEFKNCAYMCIDGGIGVPQGASPLGVTELYKNRLCMPEICGWMNACIHVQSITALQMAWLQVECVICRVIEMAQPHRHRQEFTPLRCPKPPVQMVGLHVKYCLHTVSA